MDALATTQTTDVTADWGGRARSFDTSAINVWVLAGALVLYLGFDGGGYSIASHSQVGIIVWWVVIVCSAWGLLPVSGLGRLGGAALTLLTGFVAWTAIATTWSISSGRSLQDLSLVSCYLGFFVLALAIHRDRETAVRHTVGAVATALTVIAAAAVASRLWPHLFAGTEQTAAFLGGARARLSWPLNYWNALAALVDLGIPLLLCVATSAKTLRVQAAAAAALPILVLCGALTVSRGAAIGGAVAVVVFFLLAPDRIPKLATGAVAGAGSAILVAAAFHRHAFQQGYANAAATHQAASMVGAIVLVCAGVALAQIGIGLAVRHGTPPRLLTIPRPTARVLLAVAIVALLVAGVAAGVPGRLSHTWHDFKVVGANAVPASSFSRFGATSGDGRYQYWVASTHATTGHVLGGSGPGTFQLLWLPRATFRSYVINAHSLYFETLAEVGVIGLALIVGFLLLAIAASVRLAVRSRFEQRTMAAGMAAAMIAFAVYAAFDWIWQMPVLPAAFMLLAAAALVPSGPGRRGRSTPASPQRRSRLALRGASIALGIAAVVAIIYPLATSTAVSQSQTAASEGNLTAALTDARQAVAIEPSAGAPQLQLALVLELLHDYPAAVTAAGHAVKDEPQNWSNWLILSRLDAESGNARGSVAAYDEARRLNPQSVLFHS